MANQDRIGTHGEYLFLAQISQRCRGRFYFRPTFLGDKHPTADIIVELFDPSEVQALFFVQVKSTGQGYTGTGLNERLRVNVSVDDVEKLKRYPGPTYVVGMDITGSRGFLGGIVSSSRGAINGLTTRHPIDCRTIRQLWAEVDTYWNAERRPIPMSESRFPL